MQAILILIAPEEASERSVSFRVVEIRVRNNSMVDCTNGRVTLFTARKIEETN